MDFKRNFISNIQPPTQIKINPIINIANASTPVRMRIVKPGTQLNSTPVNVHKIGVPSKSPAQSNKENDEGNYKITFKRPQGSKQNINLSPLLAFNRKMSETPVGQQRPLTPTHLKRQQSMANIQNNRGNCFTTNDQGFGQALRQSRSSNGLKNILQNRSKTPTRTPFAETLQRQSGQGNALIGGLISSESAHSLLQGGISPKLRNSRNVKLEESRSYEQLISLGNPINLDNQVLCSNSNEHEKKVKAKYKVVEEPEDDQILVYCSKCATNLVQKGFKVKDLTSSDIDRIKQTQQRKSQLNQYYEYAQQTHRKIRLKLKELASQKQNLVSTYQRELQDLQCYYNSIVSMVEEQKRKDRQIILKYLEKQKKPCEALERKIAFASNQLTQMMRNGKVGHQQLNIIQQTESLLIEKIFSQRSDLALHLNENIDRKFDHFARLFDSQGKLNLHSEESSNQYIIMPPLRQYSSHKESRQRNESLQFSFQKSLNESNRNQQGYRTEMMNTLEEASQSMQIQDSGEMIQNHGDANQKKAFRTLFPQQEQPISQSSQKQAIQSPTFKQI